MDAEASGIGAIFSEMRKESWRFVSRRTTRTYAMERTNAIYAMDALSSTSGTTNPRKEAWSCYDARRRAKSTYGMERRNGGNRTRTGTS